MNYYRVRSTLDKQSVIMSATLSKRLIQLLKTNAIVRRIVFQIT